MQPSSAKPPPPSGDGTYLRKWQHEYSGGGTIPSSCNPLPSRALKLAMGFLRGRTFRKAIDLGCGNGRNTVYLLDSGVSEVDAIDFSPAAVRLAMERTRLKEYAGRVHISTLSVFPKLPFEDSWFDLALDSYLFCHFMGHQRRDYIEEVHRILSPKGILVLSLFPPDDGYYATLIGAPPLPDPLVVTDPLNGISKQLYTETQLSRLLAPHFSTELMFVTIFPDRVAGTEYQRRVLTGVFGRM